jgi:ribonuclease J
MAEEQNKLRIIPFGGMGEIGKNMFAFCYRDEIMMIDGGLAFPDADMLGVDILVPKIDWVVKNGKKIKGWILTHGHEDHIGGLPYMLPQLPKVPIYGARLTLGLLREKFKEFKLRPEDIDLHEVRPDERVRVSKSFTVDYFRMTHSIPDNSGLVIHSPIGRIVHSGDFKLDFKPSDNHTTHLHKLAEVGAEGVLALISDSTNAERPGVTPSEDDVMNAMDKIIANAKGRVIVTTFSSHIHRLQNVIRVAEKHDRRIIVEGRSMVRNTQVAKELGYLKVKDPIATSADVQKLQDDKVLFLCTGSQGQPMAALSRLATGNHRNIILKAGDTVIMSSNPIPGNEESVNRVINQLYARQAKVFYPPAYKVHASGHASQEDLKLILELIRPRFFIPWHGEMRQQVNHVNLAKSLSLPPRKNLVVQNGDVIELTKDDIRVTEKVKSGVIYIDNGGKAPEEISDVAIRERQIMSQEGVVVIMAVASKNPSLELTTRGFPGYDRDLADEIRRIVLENIDTGLREKRQLKDIQNDSYNQIRRFLRKRTGRSPMILCTLLQS